MKGGININGNKINELFGISESFMLPDKLIKAVEKEIEDVKKFKEYFLGGMTI